MSNRPLADYGVLVTRPAAQAGALAAAIEGAGGTAVCFPAMTVEARDPEEILAEAAGQPMPDIVVFVSRNAVEHGIRSLGKTNALFAAIGPATAEAISAHGKHVDIVPETSFDSESLLSDTRLEDVSGRHITIVRGESGRELLADTLRERGAEVCYLPVYRRAAAKASGEALATLHESWQRGDIDCVTIMSVQTLDFLLQILPEQTVTLLRRTPLVAPADRVLQTALTRLPGIPTKLAAGPGEAAMLNALVAMRDSGPTNE